MSEDLSPIERRLERLEADVLNEYDACRLAAQLNGSNRVIIAEEKHECFSTELYALQQALYATGDARNLRLVSEHHDNLRIRMIYLQHLLEREIPRPYVEEALHDYRGPDYRGQVPTASSTAPAQKSLLGRMFQREKPPSPGRVSAAVPSAALKNELRVVQLHRLMEEDRQHLLRTEERPPPVASASAPAAPTARFTARDVAEAHHGQRVAPPREKIARTPEELRAKLAQREKPKGDS